MAKKESNVTVRVDSRVFYGFIAIAAVMLAIGLGWFIGNMLQDGGTETASAPSETGAPVPSDGQMQITTADENSGDTGTSSNTNGVQSSVPSNAEGASNPPVHVDEIPVGEAEPRLWIKEAGEVNWTVHLGEIANDAKFEQEFTLMNIGTSELVIEDTSASCGCTAAAVGKTNLGPGRRDDLARRLRSARQRRGRTFRSEAGTHQVERPAGAAG